MDAGPPTDNESLIIRVRLEPRERPGAEPLWRGEVADVNLSERRFFATPEELLAYLAERLGVAQRGPWWRRWGRGGRQ